MLTKAELCYVTLKSKVPRSRLTFHRRNLLYEVRESVDEFSLRHHYNEPSPAILYRGIFYFSFIVTGNVIFTYSILLSTLGRTGAYPLTSLLTLVH